MLGEEARSTTMHEQHVCWSHFWRGHDEFWFGLVCRDAGMFVEASRKH